MEQFRLAMICFKMWGELSPTKELPSEIKTSDISEAAKKKDDDLEQKKEESAHHLKRSLGQAEVESAYFKVIFN